MAQWSAKFGGSNNGNIWLVVDVALQSQNVAGNYSTIIYNAWIERRGTTSAFNNSATFGHTNINGYNPGRSLGSYNFGSVSHYDLAVNESYNIGHDAGGNANPFFGADYDLNNSPLLTTASAGGNYALPTIPRYANIDGFNIDSATDTAIQFSWHSDAVVDYISWWSTAYDGGGHHDTPSSGQGWFTINLTNLKSETLYDITVAVRRADSGLWTQSGTATPVTAKQSNFFDLSGV